MRGHIETTVSLKDVSYQCSIFLGKAVTKAYAASFLRSNIHGRVNLPNGYGLAILPSNSRFKDDKKEEGNTMTISSDWSSLKIIVSIAQLLFAVATLYRTKGDQIDQFGYAAFGLTVIPYALMSLVNLVGHLMCPQYPTMYLVQITAMFAAQQEGAEIAGIVGILDEDIDNVEIAGIIGTLDEDIDNVDRHAPKSDAFWKGILRGTLWLPLWWSPLAMTLGIIAALTRFQEGSSTQIERILTMAWLAMGFWFGAAAGPESHGRELKVGEACDREVKVWTIYMRNFVFWIVFLIAAIPVVAGFWVVANEIMRYGVCTRTI
jgi:hypothetical protein